MWYSCKNVKIILEILVMYLSIRYVHISNSLTSNKWENNVIIVRLFDVRDSIFEAVELKMYISIKLLYKF